MPRRMPDAAPESPQVSVLMAAYQAEATIRGSIESVLAQSEDRLELIVVDDGSPTPLVEALRDVRDGRLRVVRHPRNRGLGAARNTALSRARGAVVCQLDADDLWTEEYLSSILPCFEDPEVGLAYSNAFILGHPQGLDTYIPDPSVHPMDRFPKFAEQNPVPSPTAAMRTDAVRRVGGYATWLHQALDYQLYAKLILAGWRFAYIDRRLAYYRWPEPARGMSWNTRETELDLLKLWAAFVVRHPRIPGPRRQLRLRARSELSRLATGRGSA
jgi:glycosyltransferase involved in cell wall biosynthesis